MGLKTAKLSTEAFAVSCPHCEETQEHHGTGSQMFTPQDVTPGQQMKCTNRECGKKFKLPSKLRADAE